MSKPLSRRSNGVLAQGGIKGARYEWHEVELPLHEDDGVARPKTAFWRALPPYLHAIRVRYFFRGEKRPEVINDKLKCGGALVSAKAKP
jgi:hypothetical protein